MLPTPVQLRDYIDGYSVCGVLSVLSTRIDLEAPVRVQRPSGVQVRVTVRVPDSMSPGTFDASRVAIVALPTDPAEGSWHEAVDRAVWSALVDVVCHEAGECLLRAGKPVLDPHMLPRAWPWSATAVGETAR
jgi:hypothetical protein